MLEYGVITPENHRLISFTLRTPPQEFLLSLIGLPVFLAYFPLVSVMNVSFHSII